MRAPFVLLLTCFLSLLPLSAQISPAQRDTLSAQQKQWLAHSFRRPQRRGWTFVHLQGTPQQIGFQHGYWLAPEIDDELKMFRVAMPHETKKSWEFLRDAAQNMLLPHIEPQYRQELEGIVEGARARGVEADLDDIIVLNAMEALPGYYVPWYNRQHDQKTPGALQAPPNCSAFVATGSFTKDGKIVMGHNNWTDYYAGERWNVIFDIVPSTGYRIFMDGYPGVITSDDDFGVNSAGLMVTETTISLFRGWDPNGIPEFVRSRKAMQYASSIGQYVRIMVKGDNGGYANDWLIGDRKTNEIARLELGLKHYRVWRTKDGMLVGANYPQDPAVIRDEIHGYHPDDVLFSPNARRARWMELEKEYKGKIDVKVAEKMEADDYDVVMQGKHPGLHTLVGHGDLDSDGQPLWKVPPFDPMGTVQAKVIDSTLAGKLAFIAAYGAPDGISFHAAVFLQKHPEFDWQKGFLKDMIAQPWTEFSAAH